MTDRPRSRRTILVLVLLAAIVLAALVFAGFKMFEAGFYCGMADGKRNKGLYDQAIKDYERAMAIDPRWRVKAYVGCGLAHNGQGQYDQAVKDFDMAITLDPGSVKGYAGRAIALAALKQYDKAWADVKACREHGGKPSEDFIKELTTASGQSE